jgi:uncharacterized membrane protein YdjX (TVP38/TMEM64 family)
MTSPAFRVVIACTLILILSVGLICGHFDHSATSQFAPVAWLSHMQIHERRNWGAFLLLQTLVAISGVIPASFVGIAAGMIFGLAFGFDLAAASTLAGAVIAFALARSVFRPLIEGYLARRPGLQRLDGAIAQDGWSNVVLLRLSPIMPFAITSYALGLTAISWRNYVIGTPASLPPLFCYVAMGHFAGRGVYGLQTGMSPLKLIMLGIGIVATGWFTLHLGAITRRSFADGQPN